MAVGEKLAPLELAGFVEALGVAIASANAKLRQGKDADIRYGIQEAEIEVKIAISESTEQKVAGEAGLKLSVFNVNASYSRTYGFKEEASSRIVVKLAALPAPA